MSVRLERPAEGVNAVLLDRPASRNAINAAMVGALHEAVTAAADRSVRAVVLGSTTPG